MKCECHTGVCKLHNRVIDIEVLRRYKHRPRLRAVMQNKWGWYIDPDLIDLTNDDVDKPKVSERRTKRGLGDRVEQALSMIGITKERVEEWVGEECGCAERQEKLNQLGSWAHEAVTSSVENAKVYLEKLIGKK